MRGSPCTAAEGATATFLKSLASRGRQECGGLSLLGR